MTFIENAFKYGVTKKEKTVININLSINTERIDFSCQNKIYHHKSNLERSGIGIANTRQRLSHLYPQQHRLDIENTVDMYTVNLCVNC